MNFETDFLGEIASVIMLANRTTRSLVSILIGVMIVGLPRPSQAQVSTPDQATPLPAPTDKPRSQFGQLSFGPITVTPSIVIGNLGIATGVPDDLGRPKKDFTFSFGPQLVAAYKSQRLQGDATFAIPYTYYRTFKHQRGTSPTIILQANYKLTPRIGLNAWEQFGYRKDKPSAEINIRQRRYATDRILGMNLMLTPRANLSLSREDLHVTYDVGSVFRGVDLRETLSQTTGSTAIGLAYRLTPYTQLLSNVGTTRDRFPFDPDRNGRTRAVSFGARFDPRALLSGDARIGLSRFKSVSPVQPDSSIVTFDGQLQMALMDQTGILVGMRRGRLASFELTHPYSINTQYDAGIRERLGRHFDTGVSYHYGTMDYQNFVGSVAVNDHDILRSYGVSLGVTLSRWGRYAVNVGHLERRSVRDASRNYDELFVGFTYDVATKWLTLSPRGAFVGLPGF